MPEPELEQRLGAALGRAVLLERAHAPVALEQLSAGEQARLLALGSARGAHAWLLGRAALKRLLGRLRLDEDTAALSLPHAVLSLTHTARCAVAAAVLPGSGTGVDLETERSPRENAERFFLDQAEQAWVATLPAAQRGLHRLRLWTVKEALFKANLANAQTLVGHYSVADPAALAGEARWRERRFRYASVDVEGGVLTLAALSAEAHPC